MMQRIHERVEYGRSVRDRALCLLEAHGEHARGLALDAADEGGLPEAERAYWQAVAARIDRLRAQRPMLES